MKNNNDGYSSFETIHLPKKGALPHQLVWCRGGNAMLDLFSSCRNSKSSLVRDGTTWSQTLFFYAT